MQGAEDPIRIRPSSPSCGLIGLPAREPAADKLLRDLYGMFSMHDRYSKFFRCSGAQGTRLPGQERVPSRWSKFVCSRKSAPAHVPRNALLPAPARLEPGTFVAGDTLSRGARKGCAAPLFNLSVSTCAHLALPGILLQGLLDTFTQPTPPLTCGSNLRSFFSSNVQTAILNL